MLQDKDKDKEKDKEKDKDYISLFRRGRPGAGERKAPPGAGTDRLCIRKTSCEEAI